MRAVANVSKTFNQVNIHKAEGPDGLPGHALKACAVQLASVVTDIFNLSLTESVIPTCFKQTNIVPVPKKVKVNCFERRVMAHINTIMPEALDPLQFA